MNLVIEKGRLTKDPVVTYKDGKATARYTLAVDRWREGADFIPCVCFGSAAEFAEKYLTQGTKILISGRIQTGSYTNKDGKKVYSIDVIVMTQEFCEKKEEKKTDDGFLSVPEGVADALPFN